MLPDLMEHCQQRHVSLTSACRGAQQQVLVRLHTGLEEKEFLTEFSLKYLWSTTFGFKYIKVRKLDSLINKNKL